MSARKKLNRANVNGAVVIAAVVGVATQSWTVFVSATLFLVVAALYAGDIRPHGRRRR